MCFYEGIDEVSRTCSQQFMSINLYRPVNRSFKLLGKAQNAVNQRGGAFSPILGFWEDFLKNSISKINPKRKSN